MWAASVLVGAALLETVVKAGMDRVRPPGVAVEETSSFPSGHATLAAGYGLVALLVTGLCAAWAGRVTVWLAAGVVIAGVGVSRCYLGAHWASEVIAGFLLGGAWLAIVTWVARTLAPTDRSLARRPHPLLRPSTQSSPTGGSR